MCSIMPLEYLFLPFNIATQASIAKTLNNHDEKSLRSFDMMCNIMMIMIYEVTCQLFIHVFYSNIFLF